MDASDLAAASPRPAAKQRPATALPRMGGSTRMLESSGPLPIRPLVPRGEPPVQVSFSHSGALKIVAKGGNTLSTVPAEVQALLNQPAPASAQRMMSATLRDASVQPNGQQQPLPVHDEPYHSLVVNLGGFSRARVVARALAADAKSLAIAADGVLYGGGGGGGSDGQDSGGGGGGGFAKSAAAFPATFGVPTLPRPAALDKDIPGSAARDPVVRAAVRLHRARVLSAAHGTAASRAAAKRSFLTPPVVPAEVGTAATTAAAASLSGTTAAAASRPASASSGRLASETAALALAAAAETAAAAAAASSRPQSARPTAARPGSAKPAVAPTEVPVIVLPKNPGLRLDLLPTPSPLAATAASMSSSSTAAPQPRPISPVRPSVDGRLRRPATTSASLGRSAAATLSSKDRVLDYDATVDFDTGAARGLFGVDYTSEEGIRLARRVTAAERAALNAALGDSSRHGSPSRSPQPSRAGSPVAPGPGGFVNEDGVMFYRALPPPASHLHAPHAQALHGAGRSRPASAAPVVLSGPAGRMAAASAFRAGDETRIGLAQQMKSEAEAAAVARRLAAAQKEDSIRDRAEHNRTQRALLQLMAVCNGVVGMQMLLRDEKAARARASARARAGDKIYRWLVKQRDMRRLKHVEHAHHVLVRALCRWTVKRRTKQLIWASTRVWSFMDAAAKVTTQLRTLLAFRAYTRAVDRVKKFLQRRKDITEAQVAVVGVLWAEAEAKLLEERARAVTETFRNGVTYSPPQIVELIRLLALDTLSAAVGRAAVAGGKEGKAAALAGGKPPAAPAPAPTPAAAPAPAPAASTDRRSSVSGRGSSSSTSGVGGGGGGGGMAMPSSIFDAPSELKSGGLPASSSSSSSGSGSGSSSAAATGGAGDAQKLGYMTAFDLVALAEGGSGDGKLAAAASKASTSTTAVYAQLRNRSRSVVAVLGALPIVPTHIRQEAIRSYMVYRKKENWDVIKAWKRKMVLLKPFMEKQRRQAEILQRLQYRGPPSLFRFDPSGLPDPAPKPGRFRALPTREEVYALVERVSLQYIQRIALLRAAQAPSPAAALSPAKAAQGGSASPAGKAGSAVKPAAKPGGKAPPSAAKGRR